MLFCYPPGKQGPYVIPQGVDTIVDYAFDYSTKLDQITIPSTVTSLGKYIFRFSGLGAVSIPDSVARIPIGAFYACANLTNVTLPNSLQVIDLAAFRECVRLPKIVLPNSVTDLDSHVFIMCSNLTSALISTNLKRMGPNNFESCGLTNIVVPGSLEGLNNGTFDNTPLVTATIEEGVVWIGDAFTNCKQLRTVNISSSVSALYSGTFMGCTNLTSVVIGTNLSLLQNYSFADCVNLKSVLFKGNQPSPGEPNPDGIPTHDQLFLNAQPTIYYLPGTAGWSATFAGRPTVLWDAQLHTTDSNFGINNNKFGFQITSANAQTLIVEATDDLNTAWTPISTNTLQNGAALFNDSQPPARPAHFYRFRTQ